jgi:predicted membrane protein
MFSSRKNWFLGLLVIAFGVIFLLNNFGVLELSVGGLIKTYWPAILIYFGLEQLLEKNGTTDKVSGLILLFLGAFFLSRNLGLGWAEQINFSLIWRIFWPVIVILIGISFITGGKISSKSQVAFMGGIEKRDNWNVTSSSYVAFMGGIDLDLTRANIPDGETVLDLTAVMGGMEVYVPRDITVICKGFAVLGGHQLINKASGGIVSSTKSEYIGDPSNKKVIIIHTRAIMGGVDVKHKKM